MSLEIKPLDKQKATTISPIPQTSFVQYIVGGRGAGKSSMLINQLLNPGLLKGRFHEVYIISPTAKLDAKFNILRDTTITIPNKKLISILKKQNRNALKNILDDPNNPGDYSTLAKEVQFIDDLDLDMLMDIINEQKYITENFGKQYANKILFVFDDMISSKLFDNRIFKKFIFNSRHYEISTIILSQSYYGLPKALRLNVSQLILYEISNQKELKSIYEENNAGLNEKAFLELYQQVHDTPYQFFNINYFNPRQHRLYQNFTKQLS
jgi:hypothetical protein